MILHKLQQRLPMKNLILMYCISIGIEIAKCGLAMPSELRDYDSSNKPKHQSEFFNNHNIGNSNFGQNNVSRFHDKN